MSTRFTDEKVTADLGRRVFEMLGAVLVSSIETGVRPNQWDKQGVTWFSRLLWNSAGSR